jgi:hypothetical protein
MERDCQGLYSLPKIKKLTVQKHFKAAKKSTSKTRAHGE